MKEIEIIEMKQDSDGIYVIDEKELDQSLKVVGAIVVFISLLYFFIG